MPTPPKGPRLGGGPAHERLILANLATSLFEHGSITTTETKARRLRQKASAATVPTTRPSGVRSQVSRCRSRIVVPSGRARQNAAKSCSPTSGWAARSIASTSSGRLWCSTSCRRSGSAPPGRSLTR